MCGIVGYIGKKRAANILLEGLKRLEYRGYDSAGLGILRDNQILTVKRAGRVVNTAQALKETKVDGMIGISHTRWATHGGVTDANAHPHLSSDGLVSLVHNGVIENHHSIKEYLLTQGYTFQSQTDTEVLANLVAYHYAKEPGHTDGSRFMEAVRKSLHHVQGTYGIAAICAESPKELIGARQSSPLIVGIGKNENLIGSDVAAFGGRTSNVVYLNDGEIVQLTTDDFTITTINADEVSPIVSQVEWSDTSVDLGNFNHYMEKEIFEQPIAIENAMRGRFSNDQSTSRFGGLNLSPQDWRQVDRIVLLGCGTAWIACLMIEYFIERFARMPVEVDYASEFRYRNAPLDKNTLCLVVSQSGETIDTLAAIQEAKRKGHRALAITNGIGSTIARITDGGIYQYAGPEIGVASTKAFTSQLIIGAMLALNIARMRDMSFGDGQDFVKGLRAAPDLVRIILEQSENIRRIAQKYAHHRDFLFLGRQRMFPIALEGALKLKEISYIHAEGYPAAEMKHGPLALVSEKCPSVFLTTDDEIHRKTLANIQEVKARGGLVICIAPESAEIAGDLVDDLIRVPDSHEALQPILATIPVQLLSYHIACIRECDVDKPRNLAKSVTVE
ncbi:MAG: glutamine--fructose-6-phosphate transaminase (isomerizing) [Verrucomicrobiota bacterium]